MSLSVTVLGSSAWFGTPERSAAGYLVQTSNATVWLDAGGGTFVNLQRIIDHSLVDAVVLTHRHPDHTVDIFLACHARLYGPGSPMDPIPVYAPDETIERLVSFDDGIEEGFAMREVNDGDEVDIGDIRFSFVRMVHPPMTLGTRIEVDGASVAYTADTGVGEEPDAKHLRRLASGVDLLFAEATHQAPDEPWPQGHLKAGEAGWWAAELGVARLVLTHLPVGRNTSVSLEEARSFAGDVRVELAEDLRKYDL